VVCCVLYERRRSFGRAFCPVWFLSRKLFGIIFDPPAFFGLVPWVWRSLASSLALGGFLDRSALCIEMLEWMRILFISSFRPRADSAFFSNPVHSVFGCGVFFSPLLFTFSTWRRPSPFLAARQLFCATSALMCCCSPFTALYCSSDRCNVVLLTPGPIPQFASCTAMFPLFLCLCGFPRDAGQPPNNPSPPFLSASRPLGSDPPPPSSFASDSSVRLSPPCWAQ